MRLKCYLNFFKKRKGTGLKLNWFMYLFFYHNAAKSCITATALPGWDPQPSLATRDCSLLWSHSSKASWGWVLPPSPLQLSIYTTVLTGPLEITPTPSCTDWTGFVPSQQTRALTDSNSKMHGNTLLLFVSWFTSLFVLSQVLWKVNHGFTGDWGRKQRWGGWHLSVLASWPQELCPM